MNRPSPRSPWPHLQPIPVIPLFPRWGIEGDRLGFCPLRTPQRGEKGTEGGQIGSSPPRTPPGERGRELHPEGNSKS